jgi:striatin 1/3/4
MNSNDNSNPTNVNDIIKNFSNMVRNFAMKETEWQISKENYEKKIAQLEGELKAHENINIDLLKRIRMLEYELAKERKDKSGEGNSYSGNNEDLFKDLQYPNLIKEEDLKFLEESANRPSLLSILQSIGVDENLANNLFTDFELNKNELEAMIKKDIEEKLLQSDNNNNINIAQNNNNNLIKNNNINNINNLNNNNYQNINNFMDKNNNQNNIKSINNSKQEDSHLNYSFNLNNLVELRNHFDEVRKLSYLENINSLVSISEDCLIYVWSLDHISFNPRSEDVEPYLHLRGHTGPLFCVEHGRDNLIYTGGSEGLIQIFNILPSSEITSYGSSDEVFNLSIGYFQNNNENNEIYWDLKHHPKDNLLISLSSDGDITFWETTSAEEYILSFNKGRFKWAKSTKSKKSSYLDEIAIPVSCEFMKQDSNKLLVGFNDATISLMDINKNSFISNWNMINKNNNMAKNNNYNNRVLFQPNCFACCNNAPVVYTGFEDGTLKILDFRNVPMSSGGYAPNLNNMNNANNSGGGMYAKDFVIDTINIHGDAVTSLNLYKDLYLFSISHDTTIKIWDVRKMNEPINMTVGSQKKWDESMWDSLLIEKNMTLCVACADSTIKLYKL